MELGDATLDALEPERKSAFDAYLAMRMTQ
jgi:hypothetical protein